MNKLLISGTKKIVFIIVADDEILLDVSSRHDPETQRSFVEQIIPPECWHFNSASRLFPFHKPLQRFWFKYKSRRLFPNVPTPICLAP